MSFVLDGFVSSALLIDTSGSVNGNFHGQNSCNFAEDETKINPTVAETFVLIIRHSAECKSTNLQASAQLR